MPRNRDRDAYGAELLSAFRDAKGTLEIIERDDGLIAASRWPARYFSDYSQWTERERRAARLAHGRVLDIGCGAGRFALHLQKKGFRVTAIDNSPGAIQVCRWRGVKDARLLSISELKQLNTARFDTVLMMGNNFGLFGSRARAQRLLRQLHRMTSANGQIIAEATDPYHTKDPLHLGYQRANRKRGRMSGQIRFRVRHQNVIGPWFDYLLVSRDEMRSLLQGTGWKIGRIISEAGPGYTAVIVKSQAVSRAR
ncbi:MAG TPA: methyltransferase domain-containing protein [Candidatus Angelobacter sp.]|nr:methyltransferase domain-containing protein [Candidatus Angelobacter sp.]